MPFGGNKKKIECCRVFGLKFDESSSQKRKCDSRSLYRSLGRDFVTRVRRLAEAGRRPWDPSDELERPESKGLTLYPRNYCPSWGPFAPIPIYYSCGHSRPSINHSGIDCIYCSLRRSRTCGSGRQKVGTRRRDGLGRDLRCLSTSGEGEGWFFSSLYKTQKFLRYRRLQVQFALSFQSGVRWRTGTLRLVSSSSLLPPVPSTSVPTKVSLPSRPSSHPSKWPDLRLRGDRTTGSCPKSTVYHRRD